MARLKKQWTTIDTEICALTYDLEGPLEAWPTREDLQEKIDKHFSRKTRGRYVEAGLIRNIQGYVDTCYEPDATVMLCAKYEIYDTDATLARRQVAEDARVARMAGVKESERVVYERLKKKFEK